MNTKIGYLCSSTSWGGLEMNQLRNAVWMQSRGHEVAVLCRLHSPIHEKALAQGLPVIVIEKHRKYYHYAAGLKLMRILKKEKISHLIIRDTRDMSVSAIAKTLSSRHKFHLSYFMEMQLGVKKTNPLHTIRFQKLDLWSCPLNWLQEQVKTMTETKHSKIIVIPSGLEIAPFQTNQTQQEARTLLDLPENKTILGLIGRFDPHKGQVLLLEALKNVKDENTCVCLLGEPTRNEGTAYFEKIQETIKSNQLEERVFIRPFREDISTFYRAIDAFVMASKAETFGMVTIEAMASGTPTIGSNAGGTPEILKFGKLGYLFQPMDEKSLAAAINQFVEKQDAISRSELQKSALVYDHHKVCEMVESALSLHRSVN